MPSRSFLPVLMTLAALVLSACATPQLPEAESKPIEGPLPALSPQAFLAVASDIEPVAEAVCRAETPDQNCDFAILVDRDPRNGANAFQTLDRRGRPVIIITLGLIAIFENGEELAFVLGHEAGHHIARHIPEQRRSAEEGARVFSEIAMARGADQSDIDRASELGAFVGARRFSQAAELEADAIGTVIAFRAGYDPSVGARLFSRLPDPGARLLASHPPNAERQAIVRRTLADLQAGG